MKRILFILLLSVPFIVNGQKRTLHKKLVGKHLFSLQWISWEQFGTATITTSSIKNTYFIKGIQKDKKTKNYILLSGIIRPVDSKHLLFDGTIETKINHINDGKPCIRHGTFNFKVTKNRAYWRLQEMDNPCDGVADYVDIFFKKRR